MAKATVPESLIQWESRCSRELSRFKRRNDSASEISSIGVFNRSTEQSLAISVKIHGIRVDVNKETSIADKIEHREEIGAQLQHMKHSSKFYLAY